MRSLPPARSTSNTRSFTGTSSRAAAISASCVSWIRCCRREKSGAPRRPRATISPSSTRGRSGSSSPSPSVTSGYVSATLRPERLNRATSRPSTTAIVRTPSHFSSNAQSPSPSTSVAEPSVASIGSTAASRREPRSDDPFRSMTWASQFFLPVRTSASRRGCPARPPSRLPRRVTMTSPSFHFSVSYSPVSQINDSPPPYSPWGIVPSKVAYSSGWSSVGTASRLRFGSSGMPLGRAQQRSTPSRSSRRSQCRLLAWCSWTTNRRPWPEPVAAGAAGTGSGVRRASRLDRYSRRRSVSPSPEAPVSWPRAAIGSLRRFMRARTSSIRR